MGSGGGAAGRTAEKIAAENLPAPVKVLWHRPERQHPTRGGDAQLPIYCQSAGNAPSRPRRAQPMTDGAGALGAPAGSLRGSAGALGGVHRQAARQKATLSPLPERGIYGSSCGERRGVWQKFFQKFTHSGVQGVESVVFRLVLNGTPSTENGGKLVLMRDSAPR